MRKDKYNDPSLEYCYGYIKEWGALYFSAIDGDEDEFFVELAKLLASSAEYRNQLLVDVKPVFHLSIENKSSDVVSLLSLLAFYGHYHIIRKLPEISGISNKEYQHLLQWDCYNAFYWACRKGHNETIMLLFEQCEAKFQQYMLKASDKNRPYRGFADTARAGNFETLKLIIKLCEPYRHQQLIKADGCIAFSCACAYGNVELIELLWEICDPGYREKMLISSSHTPLRWALDCCNSNSRIPIRYMRAEGGLYYTDRRFPKLAVIRKLLDLYPYDQLESALKVLGFAVLDAVKSDMEIYPKILDICLRMWERTSCTSYYYLQILSRYTIKDPDLFIRVAKFCPQELYIGPKDFTREILESIAKLLMHGCALKKLSLYSFLYDNLNPLLEALVAPDIKLTELTLFGYMSSENLNCLFNALQNNTTIITLSITQHELSNAGLQALQELLKTNKTIKELCLSSAFIKDMHIISICKTMEFNSMIERFVLRETSITDVGVQSLVDMLKINKQIKLLDLKYNKHISNTGFKALEEVIALGNCRIFLSEPKLFLSKLFPKVQQQADQGTRRKVNYFTLDI